MNFKQFLTSIQNFILFSDDDIFTVAQYDPTTKETFKDTVNLIEASTSKDL